MNNTPEELQSKVDQIIARADTLGVEKALLEVELKRLKKGLLSPTRATREILWPAGYDFSNQDLGLFIRARELKAITIRGRHFIHPDWLAERFPP